MVGLAFALVAVALFSLVDSVLLCLVTISEKTLLFRSLASSVYLYLHLCFFSQVRKLLFYGETLSYLFLCKGVPQFQLYHAHMRDGINILDMLNVLAEAMLHPSPLFVWESCLYSMQKLGV